MSDVIHIRAPDLPSEYFPLELKMRYQLSAISSGGMLANDLEALAFQRAARPGEPFEYVKGGTFSSAGYATIKVESFSIWKIVVGLGVAGVVASRLFVDAGVIKFEVKDTWVDLLQLVLITVIGAYFGGRSLEKVKK